MNRKKCVYIFLICLLFITPFIYPDVIAQYKCGEIGATANQIRPHFRLVNTGGDAVPMEELTLRYFFTTEGTTGNVFSVDYASIGTGNVFGTFEPGYLEIGFLSGAGTLGAGMDTGEIRLSIHQSDWSMYDQSDDYSFGPEVTVYQDWDRVSVFRTGTQIWPVTGTSAPTPTPVSYSVEVRSDISDFYGRQPRVKFFGDYTGIEEIPFTIGPFSQPFEVYIEPMEIDVLDPFDGNYEYFHQRITVSDEAGSYFGIYKCAAGNENPKKIVTINYGSFLVPTISSTPAATIPTTIRISGTVRDINTKGTISGAEVSFMNITDGRIMYDSITQSDGSYSFSLNNQINIDFLVTALVPGYHPAKYYFNARSIIYSNVLDIECVPETDQAPTPLPVFSPTPSASPTPVDDDILGWNKISQLVPEIVDTHYSTGTFVHVTFPVDLPYVRVEEWGDPYINGSEITVDIKLLKWTFLSYQLENDSYFSQTYDLGVLPPGEHYTFVVREYGEPIAQKDFVVEYSPVSTLEPGEITQDTGFNFVLVEQGENCFADISAILVEGEGVSYSYLWDDLWGSMNRDGNVFSVSTKFARYTDNPAADTILKRYSKRYFLGALVPGNYIMEMYAGETMVKTREFFVHGETTPTPTPPANSSGCVWMVPGSSSIAAGDIFTIDVHANLGLRDLAAWGVDISWSDLSIDYIGYRAGSASVSYVEEWPEYGRISLGDDLYPIVRASKDTILFTLVFKAVAASTPTLTLGVNNLITENLSPVGVPVGDRISLTITGEGTPAPVIDATPIPTAPPITLFPRPTAEGDTWITRDFYVYVETIPGHPRIDGALVESRGLTRNAGVTDSYGYCTLTFFANKSTAMDVTVSAPYFNSTTMSFSPGDNQSLYMIGLEPGPNVTEPPLPTVTPGIYQRGDCDHDGTISIIDALLTAQYYVDLDPANFYPPEADVNCDGNINIIDALLIAQYYVNLITEFC